MYWEESYYSFFKTIETRVGIILKLWF
jgi:hypothetical protein